MWKYRSTQPDPQRDWLKPVFNPLEMTRFWPTTWLTQPNPPVLPCLETSDQSHLRKTQWLVTISLTFGNPLKFGLDSCHNGKGRPTFLHQEREHPKSCANHATHYTYAHHAIPFLRNGPLTSPRARGSVAIAGGRMKARQWFSVFEAKRRHLDQCLARSVLGGWVAVDRLVYLGFWVVGY